MTAVTEYSYKAGKWILLIASYTVICRSDKACMILAAQDYGSYNHKGLTRLTALRIYQNYYFGDASQKVFGHKTLEYPANLRANVFVPRSDRAPADF